MSERDLIILAVGGVIGYCLCFMVEIWKFTRRDNPPTRTSPERRREADPADWWKECQ